MKMVSAASRVLVVAFLATSSISALASEALESEDFRLVETKAQELAKKYDRRHVLVAYDVDNTLLAANQDLGSDQWYNWQEDKIITGDGTDAVATDFEGLLKASAVLFALEQMHPPQPEIPAVVKRLQERGFASIVLTARGSELRDLTMRELSRYGIEFKTATLPPREGYPGTYLPFDPKKPVASGLTAQDLVRLKITEARPVSYQSGVFMSSGQHKGAMLRTLIKKTGRVIKGIVFIDDHKKNCDRVQDAFKGTKVDVVTIRYAKEDANVKRFKESDKAEVIEQWKRLKAVTDGIFKPSEPPTEQESGASAEKSAH